MRPLVTGIARVCVSVCMLVTFTRVSYAKMAEPVEMPFGG